MNNGIDIQIISNDVIKVDDRYYYAFKARRVCEGCHFQNCPTKMQRICLKIPCTVEERNDSRNVIWV